MPLPLVVALDMGYGHLRAAAPIAEALGVEVLEADQPPLATASERIAWDRMRGLYALASRLSQLPVVGPPLRHVLEGATYIPPLHPLRDLSAPSAGVRALERRIRRGLGAGLVAELKRTGAPLVTTFYSTAMVAERGGIDRVFMVLTDTDVNRIWAPLDPRSTRIRFLAPTERVRDRLLAYGVPGGRIAVTGFPLPHALVGTDSRAALANLEARLARLEPDPRAGVPPLLVFAVGGAGAQVGLARRVLRGMRDAVRAGRWRVTMVAGVRVDVRDELRRAIARAGLEDEAGVTILFEPTIARYLARFDELLARTDVLWTKPSELSFFAALGMPIVIAPPVGAHEIYNKRWLIEAGAGLEQREPLEAASWLDAWRDGGVLAAAARAGFERLPRGGLQRILEEVGCKMKDATP